MTSGKALNNILNRLNNVSDFLANTYGSFTPIHTIECDGKSYRLIPTEEEMTVIKGDLKVLEILKRLFVETETNSPYYDFDNGRICVDSLIYATEEEIKLVKEWLEK